MGSVVEIAEMLVVKMLAVMESNPDTSKDPVMEFLVTGRTGRRNAMADILGPNASVTSGDLPERLQSLTTVDAEAGPSSGPAARGEAPEGKPADAHPGPQDAAPDANS